MAIEPIRATRWPRPVEPPAIERARNLPPPTRSLALRALRWSAALLLITSLPYLFGFASSPSNLVFTGLMTDVPDHAQYWSWVTSSHNGLFISNTMTPEPNPPIFMNPWMWVLSRFQLAFDLSFPALFQLWRVLATVSLMFALLAFLQNVVTDPTRRATAFVIALVGSGLGWMLVIVKHALALPDVPFPHDLYTVEANTFWSLLAYPYVPLAHALILTTILGAWIAHQNGSWRGAWLAGAASLGLALFHAYDLLTIYAVLGVFGLVEWARLRTFPWSLFRAGIVIALCSGPMAWYYSQLTAHDPLWQAILAQYTNAGVWTPPHVHLVILMGVPLLLAFAAAKWPRKDAAFVLMASWTAVSLMLIYMPTVFQIKLLAGWQFPLAILAAGVWHDRIAPKFAALGKGASMTGTWRSSGRLALVTLLILILPTNLYLFAWRFVELSRHARPYYLHQDEMAALKWLSRNSRPEDVVLAPLDVGQFVPNYGRTRSFLAHWAMTNRFFDRRHLVEQFFNPGTPNDERRRILDADQVTLVLDVDGPEDEETTAGGLAGIAWLEPVFLLDHAQIYRYKAVAPRAAPELAH